MFCLIGGSGLETIGESIDKKRIDTPFGFVTVEILSFNDKEFIFLPRHGKNHQTPPHKINFRANIYAIKKCNVTHILATAAVGSLRSDFSPGMFGTVSQFIDFTKKRDCTYFDSFENGLQHTDMTNPYSKEINLAMEKAFLHLGLAYSRDLVLVVTEGPRFETSAEIKAFSILGGDIVGMTGYPEVALANELSIPYACLAICSNYAAGILKQTLSHEEVIQSIHQSSANIKRIVSYLLEIFPC